MADRAQQIPHPPGAVADGVAPMRGGHPLVDDHGNVEFRNSELGMHILNP